MTPELHVARFVHSLEATFFIFRGTQYSTNSHQTWYLQTVLHGLCLTKLLKRRDINGFCLILTKEVNLEKEIIQPEQ